MRDRDSTVAKTPPMNAVMGRVDVHCYGCPAKVRVHDERASEDLRLAGWTVLRGETCCPTCSRARGIGEETSAVTSLGAESSSVEAASVGLSVREARDFVDHTARRAAQLIVAGLLALAVGLYLLLFTAGQRHSSVHADPRVVLIGTTLILGPLSIGAMAWWLLSVLPRARLSMSKPPVDLLLTASISHSRGGVDSASLWRGEGERAGLVAKFNRSLTPWSRPFKLHVYMKPARVFGAPTGGEIVVVTFDGGALVGRIRRSRFTTPSDTALVAPASSEGYAAASGPNPTPPPKQLSGGTRP